MSDLIAGNQYLSNDKARKTFWTHIYVSFTNTVPSDLVLRLNPIPDASHTRNRNNSPPNSECKTDGVLVGNLDDHSLNEDIRRFLQSSFQIAVKRDPIIQAYILEHGELANTTGHAQFDRAHRRIFRTCFNIHRVSERNLTNTNSGAIPKFTMN